MILALLAFAVGAGFGVLALWLATPKPAPAPAVGLVEIVALVSRSSHDLRGAVSPALLMVERLEHHPDGDVRQAATLIAEALERTAAISRATSAAVKQHLHGS